ncbi:MAG TPA: hypothetical protein VFS34_04945 [Thermoanaerobaculia bacterium]|nr:hypothetical protein [Thermoanaerobaculia bacterium]
MTLLLWVLYAAGAVAIGGAARFVKRPIPGLAFSAFVLLPVLHLLPGFVSDRTAIPVQDVRLVYPWTVLPAPFGNPEPPRNPNLNDIALQIAPWTEAVRSSWKGGVVPWLDRWNGSGMPLAANGQSGAFSPFTLAGLPLPLGRSFTLAEALRLLVALAGTWLWIAELGGSGSAAFAGALAFGFSLLMTVWLPWPFASVVALWPWAFFLLERLDDPRGRARSAALLVAVLVAWAVSGHPESAAVGAAFALLWTVFRLLSRGWSSPRAVIGSAAVAAVVAVGLSAPLLLPELDAIRASNRRANAERIRASVAAAWPPHAPRWKPGFVVPLFPAAYGDAVNAPMFPRVGYSFPEVSSGYAGAAAWILAFMTLRPGSRRRKETLALAAAIAAAVAASTWTWPAVEILTRVPGLGIMLPLRFQGWIPFCVATLAALEFDRWRRDVTADRRRSLWTTAAAAAFALLAAGVFLRYRHAYAALGGLRAEALYFGLAGSVAAAVGAAGILASRRRLRASTRSRLVLAAFAVGSVAELFAISRPLDRFGRSSAVFPATPLVDFLRSRPGTFRTLGVATALFPGSNVFAGVEDVRTHDPLERRDYVEFLDAAAGYPPEEYFKTFRNPEAPLFDLLNVEYAVAAPDASLPAPRWEPVYSGRDGNVFRNRTVRARVWAPRRVRIVGKTPAGHPEDAFAAFGLGPAELVGRIGDGDEALVVSDGKRPLPARDGGPAPAISAISSSGRSLAFTAQLEGAEPAVVVASEVQDGGWRARDERGPLATGRADGPLLAVAVRPGRHRVTLTYAPPHLPAGLAAAAAAALLGGAALAAAVRRERTASPARGVT